MPESPIELTANDAANADLASGSEVAWAPGSIQQDKVLFAGGSIGGVDGTDVDTVEIYDPAGPSVSATASLPAKRNNGHAAATDSTVYYIAGAREETNNVFSDVYAYDISAGSWSAVANYPISCRLGRAEVVNGEVYSFGGDPFDLDGFGTNNPFNDAYKYDPSTDTWTTLTSMPTAKTKIATFVLGANIYILCGYDGSNTRKTCHKYDTTADSYTQIADFPYLPDTNTYLMAASVDNDTSTPWVSHEGPNGNFITYDADADSWTVKSISVADQSARVFTYLNDGNFHYADFQLDETWYVDPESETGANPLDPSYNRYFYNGDRIT